MRERVRLLGIFYYVVGTLFFGWTLLFGLTGLFGGLGLIAEHDTPQDRLVGTIGSAAFALVAAALGAAHVYAGVGLRRLRSAAQTLGIVLAVLDVLACCLVPFSTVLGIVGLIVLLNREAASCFEAASAPVRVEV